MGRTHEFLRLTPRATDPCHIDSKLFSDVTPQEFEACVCVYAPSHDRNFCFFYGIFDPPDPGTRKINDFHQKSIEHRPILTEIGFQKLRIGRGSVLTKYEPVASCVDPV